MTEGMFIKCLAQPQVSDSALISEPLKAIPQIRVNHTLLALCAYGFDIVCTEHLFLSVLPERHKRRTIHPAFPLN